MFLKKKNQSIDWHWKFITHKQILFTAYLCGFVSIIIKALFVCQIPSFLHLKFMKIAFQKMYIRMYFCCSSPKLYAYLLELFVSDSSNQENSVNILTVRRYVMGIGLVLVAIMVLINIFNIHTYRKRNNQDKETIHPAIWFHLFIYFIYRLGRALLLILLHISKFINLFIKITQLNRNQTK